MNEQALTNLALSESGFLFDAVSGNTFTLNKTAKLIVKGIIAGLTHEKIAENLADVFEVSYERVSSDVQQFIHHLVKIHVIPEADI